MVDFIIVGAGLAGISFAEVALQNGKSIIVFDNDSQTSSKIAAGIYNPVILKRFSQVWKANEQILLLNEFYPQIENRLNVQLDYKLPVIRKFFSIEEQNDWAIASDKPSLSAFLATEIINKQYVSIQSPFGYGKVLDTGYVDTKILVNKYRQYLVDINSYTKEPFVYNEIVFNEDYITYKDIKAKQIIFAEGFGLHSNPFFNYLPLDGTKGEILVIKSPELNLDCILNASVFILPLGNNLYKVGATYNWNDKTDIPTEEGKQELLDKLKEIIDCEFEVISHFAGVRPTVNDRRPIVGTHHIHKRIHILNGLGTRGVMLGPFLSKALYNSIEHNIPIDKEIDIIRFHKKRPLI